MDIFCKIVHEFMEDYEGIPLARNESEIIEYIESQGYSSGQSQQIIMQCIESGFLIECTKGVYI